MEILKGTAAFPGMASGKILYYEREQIQALRQRTGNIKKEIADFEEARNIALSNLEEILRKGLFETEQESFEIRKQIDLLFSGRFIRAIEGIITNEKKNAVYAIIENRDEIKEIFSKMEDEVVKDRIRCVESVSEQLIRVLGGFSVSIDLGREPVILVAENLTPSEIIEMDKSKLLAVVLHKNSSVSHTAIMAKTMEVPTLMGIDIDPEWDGHTAIVDCNVAKFFVDPNEETQKEYEIRKENGEKEWAKLLLLRDAEDVTLDGKRIGLMANIGHQHDVPNVLYYKADGIGLLRSEFQYLGRDRYPREKELFEVYKMIAQRMEGKPVVIRTSDLGMDKKEVYMELPDEENPLMGNRGIRLCLDRKRMFRAQLRAILRASAYGELAILYPMITSEKEIDLIEDLIQLVKANLDEKGIPYNRNIKTGIMIETPAAVMIAEELASRVDFLALGTNDLTQYTLAMDRQNPMLKSKYDDHHPAVLKMIEMTVKAAHKENRQVYICGELAADTELTERFIAMGVDGLSVVPGAILPVRKAIRNSYAHQETK